MRLRRDAEVWEIEQKGATLEITVGLHGKRGKTTVRKFLTVAHAEKQLPVLVDAQLAAGYSTLEHAPDTTSGELEAAITDDPYNATNYAVYADWLISCGDPRGELAALQIAAQRQPDDPALAKAAARLLKKRESELLGPVAKAFYKGYQHALTWRAGFVHAISIAAEDYMPYRAAGFGLLIDYLVHHPAGRFLTEVSLHDAGGSRLSDALKLLAAKTPATLRALTLHVRDVPQGKTPLDVVEGLEAVARAAPRIARLAIRAPDGNALSGSVVRLVAVLPWPALESLELWLGNTDATVDDFAGLLDRIDLPRLAHLRLRNVREADALRVAIAASPLAAQLVLDLDE